MAKQIGKPISRPLFAPQKGYGLSAFKLNNPFLSAKEQAFLDGPVQQLLDLSDEWRITHEDADLSPEAWRFIKAERLWAMIIPERYGGLGFSAYDQSCVLA